MKYLRIIENQANDLQFNGFDFNIILTMVIIFVVIIYLMFRLYEWNRKRPKYIGHRKPNGWSRETPFYRAYCEVHGYYENSLMGWKNKLICPKCIDERVEKYE